MKRLWRSVIILAVCLISVIFLRVYLTEQAELARARSESETSLLQR